MSYPKILAIVLAGGEGKRLFPLTAFRSKPSVPFGGRYRIVDFVLSNLLNSNLHSIYLLVQYKSQSLIEHVRQNWVLTSVIKDHFVTVVPPQMLMGPEWFQGTADAVFQNINLIYDFNPDLVLVFGADHVYRMDILQMIDFHLRCDASVTVAARPVPIEQASSFGVIVTDKEKRISGFLEKPENPVPMPDDPASAYVSMGNYIFDYQTLLNTLKEAEKKNQHDFGAHIIPSLLETGSVYAYDFATNKIPGTMSYEEAGYWRDVGTISAYFDANMDMLGRYPLFEIENKLWPIHPAGLEKPATKILHGVVNNSIIAEGTVINNARIENSVIRSGVVIQDDVVIEDCIILDNTVIKKGSHLRKVIADKLNVIEEGERIGFDPEKDSRRCTIDPSGIAIIPRGCR